MANGIGDTIYFNCAGAFTGGVTGSVESYSITEMSELTEVTSGTGGFIFVGKTKIKHVIDASIILKGSGSAIVVPKNLDSATWTDGNVSGVSGTWTVTNNPKVSFASAAAAKCDIQLTQWFTDSGTVLA